jgi:hypothetical protein
LPRLRSAACGKTHNASTGAPLAWLRHRARWGAYAQALIDGQSVRAGACLCGVHKSTSYEKS